MSNTQFEASNICTICLEPHPELTLEHIMPDGLGGSLQVPALCKSCNSKSGSTADALLINHDIIQMNRAGSGTTGKRGRVPVPFRGSVKDEKGRSMHQYWDDEGRLAAKYPDGGILHSDLDTETGLLELDGIYNANTPLETILESINKKLTRNGKTPITMEQLEASIEIEQREHTQIRGQMVIGLHDHAPGLIKIAHLTARYFLGPKYLEDFTGELIANALEEFIAGGTEPGPWFDELSESLGCCQIPLVATMLAADDSNVFLPPCPSRQHQVTLALMQNSLGANVLVACVTIYSTFLAIVPLSQEPERYTKTNLFHRIEFDAVARSHKFVNLLEYGIQAGYLVPLFIRT